MNKTKETILVVDDTLQNLSLMNAILEPSYNIKTALNGKEALKSIATDTPSLILLDVVMPDMDGYELCQLLKNDPKTNNIPIIFVTSKNQTENETLGLSLGAVDYIHKPINIPILQARIKTHLSHSHLIFEVQKKCTNTIVKERKNGQKRSERSKELADMTIKSSRLEVIKSLARAAEFKDNETGLHVQRVSHYSRLLAQQISSDDEFIDMVFEATLMHDIGKIGIPDAILLKQGRLTTDEFSIIKSHTEIGASIIDKNQPGVLGVAYNIALTHHEKWDGSGYPQKLKEYQIPIEGRIVAIVDVFDALTSIRPYKRPWSIEKTVQFLQNNSAKHFDPNLVSEFLKILPKVIKIQEKYNDANTLMKPSAEYNLDLPYTA